VSELMKALDLPTDFHQLQSFYWQAEREWKELDAAYDLVLRDLLKRHSQAQRDRRAHEHPK
jgi:hypothetical protein